MKLRTASALAALAATLLVTGCGSDDNEAAPAGAKQSSDRAYGYAVWVRASSGAASRREMGLDAIRVTWRE